MSTMKKVPLKPFTREGRFECGMDQIVAGKVWAFAAVLNHKQPGPQVGLGIAIANETGYVPIPIHWCHADDFHEMSEHADFLNGEEGLSPLAAAKIVASTMRKIPKKGT